MRLILCVLFFLSMVTQLVSADQVDELVRQTKSEDKYMRWEAVRQLGTIKDPKAVDALLQILKSHSDNIACSKAVEALGDQRGALDPRAVEPLIQALRQDSYEFTRSGAAKALRWFKDARALDPLREALQDKSYFVRMEAAGSLSQLAAWDNIRNAKAVEPLIQLLSDPEGGVRSAAASALGAYKDPRAVEPLIKLFGDPEPSVRSAAASAAAGLKDDQVKEALRPLLNDPDAYVRDTARRGLESLGSDVTAESVEKQGSLRKAFELYLDRWKGNQYYDIQAMEKIMEIAAKLDPPPAIPEEARRAMAQGKAAFEMAQDNQGFQAAEKEFKKARDLAPWWADTYFNLALVEEKMGMLTNAKIDYEYYRKAAPGASDTPAVQEKIYQMEYKTDRRMKARELVNQGNQLWSQNRIDEAMAQYQEAIRQDPNYGLAHANLALGYLALKRYKEAIPEYKEGIRLGDRRLKNYYDLAWCIVETEQNFDEAIQILEEGLKVDPYSMEEHSPGVPIKAAVHYNLGWYYEKKNNREKAVYHYEQAIALGDPNQAKLRQRINQLK